MKSIAALLLITACLAVALPAQAGGLSSELLLSSAWCTFKYNQITGYSTSTRVRFAANGTYSTGGRAEGSTSGKSGSYASQRDTQGGGAWKVVQGELYMSEGYGQLELVQTVVKRNSTGATLVIADGVEYAQCQ